MKHYKKRVTSKGRRAGMSSFGDGNPKTRLQEWLDDLFYDRFGHHRHESTAEEKVQFLAELFDVLRYMFED